MGEAFSSRTIVLMKGSVDVYNEKVVRCSMGAVIRGRVQALEAEDANELALMLQGYRIFAVAAGEGLQPQALGRRLSGRDAFIFGNEARGISEEVLALADENVRIPMSPGVDSLNVGIAAGIVLHAAVTAEIA